MATYTSIQVCLGADTKATATARQHPTIPEQFMLTIRADNSRHDVTFSGTREELRALVTEMVAQIETPAMAKAQP